MTVSWHKEKNYGFVVLTTRQLMRLIKISGKGYLMQSCGLKTKIAADNTQRCWHRLAAGADASEFDAPPLHHILTMY